MFHIYELLKSGWVLIETTPEAPQEWGLVQKLWELIKFRLNTRKLMVNSSALEKMMIPFPVLFAFFSSSDPQFQTVLLNIWRARSQERKTTFYQTNKIKTNQPTNPTPNTKKPTQVPKKPHKKSWLIPLPTVFLSFTYFSDKKHWERKNTKQIICSSWFLLVGLKCCWV